MKVIAPEYQNKITLSTMLLELQFSMELSQLETVLSCYQELFAFFLQYGFLLKNREIASQGGDFALKEDELTTPDPARDGTNWLVYCAANPVGRWDPSGLSVLDDYAYQLRTNSQPGSEEYEESFKIEEEAARRNQGVSTGVVTNSETPSLSVMQFAAAVMRIIPYYPAYTTVKNLTYISEKREEALDWADENWPSWLTLTGSVRMDQDAIAAAMAILRPEIGLAQQSLLYMMPLLEASGVGSQLLLGGNTTSTLGLPLPTGSNPWMEGSDIICFPAPKNFYINMAQSNFQNYIGGWGTLEDISSVDFARNFLAITPEFKETIDSVQKFLVPEGFWVQKGITGPQVYKGTIYPGGANQIQLLENPNKLIPIDNPKPLK